MYRVIAGTRYDTSRATFIVGFEADVPVTSWRWYQEHLYRTRGARWILHGAGNAGSYWGKVGPGGIRTKAENIWTLTDAQAQEWLEERGEAALLAEYFPKTVKRAGRKEPLSEG